MRRYDASLGSCRCYLGNHVHHHQWFYGHRHVQGWLHKSNNHRERNRTLFSPWLGLIWTFFNFWQWIWLEQHFYWTMKVVIGAILQWLSMMILSAWNLGKVFFDKTLNFFFEKYNRVFLFPKKEALQTLKACAPPPCAPPFQCLCWFFLELEDIGNFFPAESLLFQVLATEWIIR